MENAATGALHPDLVRFSAEMADTLANFESLCSGLTDTQFNWSPEPGRWSVAQNLLHLIAVDGQDVDSITRAVADARARNLTSPGPYKYPFWNNYFIRLMEPPVKQKYKTYKTYMPPPTAPLAATLAEYRRVSHSIRAQVLLANGLDLQRAKTPMPALRFFKMALGARFALLCAHDRRHLWQARNIRNHPSFPSN
jgi:hypothetical protein